MIEKKKLILVKTVGIFKTNYLLLIFGVWHIPVHTRNSDLERKYVFLVLFPNFTVFLKITELIQVGSLACELHNQMFL